MTNSIHEPTTQDLTHDTTDTSLFNVREFGAVCVLPQKEKQERNSSTENAI